MRCSGCGKEVPFGGEVCPYCQRDKSGDQQIQVLLSVCVVGGMGLGYLFNGFTGLLWGAGIGGVVGIGVGIAAMASNQSKAPQVRVSPESESQVAQNGNIKKRLSDLEALRSDGLVSEAEFAAKRQHILNDL